MFDFCCQVVSTRAHTFRYSKSFILLPLPPPLLPQTLPGATPQLTPIEQTVAQLQGMGFDDEGGWLTELVKAKGGDIERVLDALHPSQSS